ncbi:uncharacterized protein PGTG_22612 [Puccinia graminis f. sp. tritici CRL 75-36-700-3]|uniref:Uncharacterized protein n=1 Tax=Puccinia graminis f. sp. tritici (strain CRL 75-36-700-3 / race SCCL) TaxID=418459 RepID=H6QV48_PUCGT|nr:uncharacterized protein PGTG_22612 [Puccinia graminis f. sp. tritici CRL 75-36-700-3]EHS62709.1 hypothetical protein PGTG_22612 [Puccinia graminis f. sp. tritici CRL 75-36-700-3]
MQSQITTCQLISLNSLCAGDLPHPVPHGLMKDLMEFFQALATTTQLIKFH